MKPCFRLTKLMSMMTKGLRIRPHLQLVALRPILPALLSVPKVTIPVVSEGLIVLQAARALAEAHVVHRRSLTASACSRSSSANSACTASSSSGDIFDASASSTSYFPLMRLILPSWNVLLFDSRALLSFDPSISPPCQATFRH